MAADPHSAEYHAQVLSLKPSELDKARVTANPVLIKQSVDNFTSSDTRLAEWSLAVVYDLLRADGSVFSVFEEVLHKLDFYKQTMACVKAPKTAFIGDKAAWLLSAMLGNVPAAFTQAEAQGFVEAINGAASACSEQGKLDAAVNVMKADAYRALIVRTALVDLNFDAQSAPPGIVYKKMFILWLLSFGEGSLPVNAKVAVQKVREVLTYSRVEKVVRMALMCLQSLIPSNQDVAEEVVEQDLLDVVQSLEYEKWRDAELYEDIKSMSAQIATRVAEMSNFARYERELNAGKLKWGFIHSTKFWSENVLKFEQHDWRALKALSSCLDLQGDATCVAVACRDLGEFVTCHPLGKKQIAALGVKDKVMKLMSSNTDKEVRREALLCCQKIMLNKWQDMDTSN